MGYTLGYIRVHEDFGSPSEGIMWAWLAREFLPGFYYALPFRTILAVGLRRLAILRS
jgi:hypothetical protein